MPWYSMHISQNSCGLWIVHLTRQDRPRTKYRLVASGTGQTQQEALRKLADSLDKQHNPVLVALGMTEGGNDA